MQVNKFKAALAAFCLVGMAANVQAAPAVLNTGLVQMGVFDSARLGGTGVGLVGPSGDAITPGCLCEGWGAAASGVSGYTDGSFGTSGITSAALTVTTASGPGLAANSVVTMANGLQVSHTYSYAAGGVLFKVAVNMLNTTAGLLTDVRYARTLDWDVAPGHFSDDRTTIYGGTPTGPGGKVLHTSTNPFAAPNPMVFRSANANTNVVDAVGDLGGYFVFGFGDLLAGASHTFDTYIGAAPTTAALLSAFGTVGVEAYSYSFDNDGPATYGYGFAGLGLPPVFEGKVPEPGSIALLAVGLLGVAGARRRRRA